uniref:non-specific serine/threonine protein kinase n=1 Tax=Setaria italica TaxID=4555 RepID=K3ZNL3_SETIT
MFSLSELKAATENFSDGNKIGMGGFGGVYKGVLQDGRLYDGINVFVDLKHKNITRPLGYCHEVIMVLISHTGKYARDQKRQFCFDIIWGSRFIGWSCRFKMIERIVQGLHYLHEQRVVHMDLKPENILFDSDMNPRISDFGIARKLDLGVEKTFDSSIGGTIPYVHYMAPEYKYKGCVPTKCDVYSFGNTLLGTIIGSMIISTPPNISELIQWAFEARDNIRMELFKSSLCCKSQLMQIKKCMEIGLLCVEQDREHRPTMTDALATLNGVKELPALKRRPYPYRNFE